MSTMQRDKIGVSDKSLDNRTLPKDCRDITYSKLNSTGELVAKRGRLV
jgi:hypothetical protein